MPILLIDCYNYRSLLRLPRPTADQIARWAKERAPKRLSPSEHDPLRKTIRWPGVLLDECFAPYRNGLEKLFAARDAHHSGVASMNHLEVRRIADAAEKVLKSRIREYPPSAYMAARRFLESLTYESRFVVPD